MADSLRAHQIDFSNVLEQVRQGSQVREVVVFVTPGGGKSLLPVIAGIQLIPGIVDKICWVVPRLSLARQAAQEFSSGTSKKMLGHSLDIRQSTNEFDPTRGTAGYVTTYDAIQERPEMHELEFGNHRYALILDECHHIVEGGPTHAAIAPLVAKASFLILMSGTLERNVPTEKIAFMNYEPTSPVTFDLDLTPTPTRAVVVYALNNALYEQAVLPIRFNFHDGSANYIKGGKQMAIPSIAAAERGEARAAIYTAIQTEHSDELLRLCVADWRTVRSRNPRAKLLIVAARIDHAKLVCAKLVKMGISSIVATSQDPDAAQRAINAFRESPQLNCLVTVMMAYEGMDVPGITHICCLTHIRSKPWIEQMVSRANRVDRMAGPYASQTATVYAPDDVLIREVVWKIQNQQTISIKTKNDAVPKPPEDPDYKPDRFGVYPLRSSLTGAASVNLGKATDIPGSGSTASQIIAQLTQRAAAQKIATKAQAVVPGKESIAKRELLLRKKIEQLTKYIDKGKKFEPGRVNKEIYKAFGKPRADMTEAELARVVAWIETEYKLKKTG